jgi:CheY-like chemotaxis protein
VVISTGMGKRDYLIWLIDDSEANHQAAIATTAKFAWVRLEHFYTGSAAIAEFTEIESSAGRAPDAVLMDYFLDGERGDQITADLRRAEVHSRPVIIGYSSVASGSAAIVAAGGDLVVRKHMDANGVNPSLAGWLRSLPQRREGA